MGSLRLKTSKPPRLLGRHIRCSALSAAAMGGAAPAPRIASRTQTTGLFQQSREAGKA
jgi:hypothetical protein